MATLTAWKFDTVGGADQAIGVLKSLESQQLIKIQDGAIVTWEESKKKPKTRQLAGTTSKGAMSGAFWGMLFGLLFFVPFLGLAIGAATGAITAKFTDYGIDDNFINSVKQQVTPGTSALFLLSESQATDRVVDAVKAAGLSPTLMASNLSKEQEAALQADFGEE